MRESHRSRSAQDHTPPVTQRELAFAFERAEVGDHLEFKLFIPHAPLIGKYLSLSHHFQLGNTLDDGVTTVKVPVNFPVASEIEGFDKTVTTIADGQRIYKLTYQNTRATPLEPDAADVTSRSPRVMMSSLRDYAHLGTAIHKRFIDAMVVTPEIAKIAAAIVRPSDTPEQSARKLYRWIEENIRYTDQALVPDGISPHSANEILARRQGDCKDYTVLLGALLAARSIKSTPALLNTGNEFKPPKVPTAQTFNHVITFIPQLGLYVDPTGGMNPFGVLPANQQGKPVLHLDTGKIRKLDTASSSDSLVVNSKIQFTSAGDFQGISSISGSGSVASEIRRIEKAFAGDTSPAIRAALSKQGIAQPGGSIHFAAGPASNHHRSTLNFSGENLLNMQTANSLAFNPYLRSPSSLSSFALKHATGQRRHAFRCGGGHVEENFEILLPPNMEVAAMPNKVAFQTGPLRYLSTYDARQGRLVIKRRLSSDSKTSTCLPSEYESFHQASKVIMNDLNSRVSLKPI